MSALVYGRLKIALRLLCAGGVIAAICASGPVFAVPANPEGAVLTQPDGSKVTVYLRGDEHVHWHEDGAGYLVQKSPKTNRWMYAEESNGKIVPTNHILGKVDPRKIGLRLPNIKRIISAGTVSTSSISTTSTSVTAASTTGTMKNLVVLVNFSDLTIPYTRQQYDDLFNQVGYNVDGAVGSVKDYYHEISNNQLTVDSVVVEPVTLDNGYAYYGADYNGFDIRPREMVSEALYKLNSRGFDFRTVDGNNDGWVDGLTIIHAGFGQEYSGNSTDYIWSHQWELASSVRYDTVKMQSYHTEPAIRGWTSNTSSQGITRIGTICHENGHFLGLPDLYDTTMVGSNYASTGVGNFCLMGSGSWGGGDGKRPVQMSAWCKSKLGWITVTPISTFGSYQLTQVETSHQAYKIQGTFPYTQYFLLENRQGVGFDASLPGSTRGMLIWHIDETMTSNDDKTHYLVDLEEASGTQDMENAAHVSGDDDDYFRSGTMTSFTQTTTPDFLSYSGVPLGYPITAIGASSSTMRFYVGTDTTPPVAYAPTDDGAYTASTSVTFRWVAGSDLESGLASYNCRIGTSPGASDVFSGNVGNVLTKTVTVAKGHVYYSSVQAVDYAGNTSAWSASSDGIAAVNSAGISIAAAKNLADMSWVGISSGVVTAVFANGFYIESTDRVSGIRVVTPVMPVGLTLGSVVNVGGVITRNASGERYIDGAVVIL